MNQKWNNKFCKFQHKYGWSGKRFRLNLRPVFHFFWMPSAFTIPDFYIEIFKIFSITFMCGHSEWFLIFKLLKKEKTYLLGKH